MAVADAKKHLKEMIKVLNDAYARGQLDAERQIVTLEKNNIVEAWKEGYSNLVEKHKGKREFPDIDSINFVQGVTDAWDDIEASITANKGTIRFKDSNQIVFNENKMTKNIYNGIKSHLVTFVQEVVGKYKLTGAKEEAEQAGAPTKDIFKYAGRSDIGTLKKGTHRLHKENTAVGSARLALSMKWMSKTRFFKDFLTSQESQKLVDKYGDLISTWETKGTKSRGLKVTPTEDIKISVSFGKDNKRGDEPEDFANIFTEIEKAVLAWAKEAEIQGRKGSISIEENAVNIVEQIVVDKLAKVKGARVKKKPVGDQRKEAKTATYKESTTQRNKGRTSKGRVKRATKRRTNTSSIASQPLRLVAMINQKLPETVRKNMIPPALVNRSGRFADSVKATDVIPTPQGFPSIGYTYRKDPYEVFEMGVGDPRWATPERDPRRIIDRSIREIAVQLAIGRFYTRRN